MIAAAFSAQHDPSSRAMQPAPEAQEEGHDIMRTLVGFNAPRVGQSFPRSNEPGSAGGADEAHLALVPQPA
jgi:hypothetical protein